MTIGTTYSFMASIRHMYAYAAPIDNAVFTSTPGVFVNGVNTLMALYTDIPSLTSYAP